MAPPHKRRRLSGSNSDATEDAVHEPTATFSHGLEHLSSPTKTAAHTIPHVVEEVHLQIHQQAISDVNHAKLHRRQDGIAAASDLPVIVSVVASIDLGGSTTALTTATVSPTVGSLLASDETSTTTFVASPSSSGSESTSSGSSTVATASASTTDASSQSDTAATSSGTAPLSSTSLSGTAPLSSSDTAPTSSSTAASSEPASSTISPTSTPSGLESGFIGISPIPISATTSSSSTNGTITSVSTDSAIAAITGAAAQNLTTSAIIFESNSTTSTSKTTIDLAISTSKSGTASPSHTASLDAFVYLATLADGTVETISRHSSAYVTTFPDGVASTISAISGTAMTTVLPDGATSVFYETTSLPQTATGGSQSTVTSVATVGPGGAAAESGQTGSATSTHTTSAGMAGSGGSNNNSNNSTPPAGTIAGGVVGGAAGLAFILLIAMLFLRWYRRKSQLGHQALPPSSSMTPEPDQSAISRHPGMAERAGMMPLMAAVPALFRHQNRSQETAETDPSERGFTRVSGRKLPSNFSPGMSSPGMSSPPPTMPMTGPEHNMSNTSFYRDSAGYYGGEGTERPLSSSGVGTGAAVGAGAGHEDVTLSPGPQRRPTVHAGGPYVMSPTATATASPTTPHNPFESPRSPPRTAGTMAMFDRSDTPSSMDPSRSSRFTEEV